MNKRYVSNSAKQTLDIGFALGQSLQAGDVVALYGGLGAGKTVFAKGVAHGLGINEEVVSPTFTLLKEYHGKFKLNHFDLYRIEDEEELFHIGFYDCLGADSVCVIEWAQHASDLPPCIEVSLEGSGTDERIIEIKGAG